MLGINDSKQTKEHERECMYEVLINHPDVLWSVSVVSHTEIDDVNILQGMYVLRLFFTSAKLRVDSFQTHTDTN